MVQPREAKTRATVTSEIVQNDSWMINAREELFVTAYLVFLCCRIRQRPLSSLPSRMVRESPDGFCPTYAPFEARTFSCSVWIGRECS